MEDNQNPNLISNTEEYDTSSFLSSTYFGKKYYNHGCVFDDLFYAMSCIDFLAFDKRVEIEKYYSPLSKHLDQQVVKTINKQMAKDYCTSNHTICYVIGDPDSRYQTCTISITLKPSEKDLHFKGDIWVSFRALNLVELSTTVTDIFSFVFGNPQNPDTVNPNVTTIKYIVTKLQQKLVNEETGLHQGYCEMLSDVKVPVYSVKSDNSVSEISQESIIDALCKILQQLIEINKKENVDVKTDILELHEDETIQFDRIIFCGFSLGAGTSLVAASLVHRYLDNRINNLPEFDCFQFAGTKVGNETAQEYCDTNFGWVFDISIKDDPVICIPGKSQNLSHIASQNLYLSTYVDETNTTREFTKSQFEKLIGQPICREMQILSMALGFVSPNLHKNLQKGGILSEDRFRSKHLYGAEFLALFFIYQIKEHNLQNLSPYSPYFRCNSFNKSVLLKYNICPSSCELDFDEDTNKKSCNISSVQNSPVLKGKRIRKLKDENEERIHKKR